MAAQDSPRPVPLSRGFSRLETLPEDFASRMSRDVEIGDVIGERYRLIDRIGDGAMGQVFLAENLAIGMRVAVKLLKPELLANPDFRLRFKHKAEAVAAIQHPNVARFLDLVVGDPTFLVMEYVDGPTLEQVIAKEGPLPPRRAAEIAVRLCWGLHAAHRAGIIHRDLKPSNILLQPDEESGDVPKIIDFGLAKLEARGAPLTRIGQLIGTPAYMAPEQIGGKEVDGRADVYALACVLYAMLSGRPPFISSTDDVELLYRQVHEPAEPITRYASHVGPELEAVLMRALEKDPALRYPTMRDLARALEPALEQRNTRSTRPSPSPSGETQLILRPKRAWLPLSIGAVALAAIGVLLTQVRWSTPNTLLLVITEPAGAQLELDGVPLPDPTPAALWGVKPGEHTIKIRRAHHTDVLRTVNLTDGARETMELRLPPESHALEVQTVPGGATTFLDGQLVAGKTPVAISLTNDEYHVIRVEKPGYETYTLKLQPEQVAPLAPITLQPESRPRGTLYADSSGPAELWIDGQYSGFMTPTPGLRLNAGEHQLELRSAAGAATQKQKVSVGQGETVRLVLPMPGAARR